MPVQESQSSHENVPSRPGGAASIADPPLSFALNFISGRGMLSTRDRQLGGIAIKLLELEIPNIAFPFDVTGGADRFKTRRCILKHLVFSLDGDSISRALAAAPLAAQGFVELTARVRENHLELNGRFKAGDAEAAFTVRASLVLRSLEELAVVFFDARVYAPLPVPAALLPVYLARALNLPYVDASRAGLWIVRPIEHFVRVVLPQSGWKIPDTRSAQLITAEVARGRVTIAAGPEADLTQRQLAEREPPEEAVLASEGIIALTNAEKALASGGLHEAWENYRDAFDEGRGGRWARERLLQLGAADPELTSDTRQLAEEALVDDPNDRQALLALATMALREHSFGEAANRFGTLAEIAHARKEQRDIVAAELATAAAAMPIDPAGALAAYERAAARARDSVVAHQALFTLRLQMSDWTGAIQAGERLLRLLTQPEAQAAVHRELGKVHRLHAHDFKQARAHFERALRLAPDDPDALEGLAETYAARGEPGRAASYLGRLAEQAEGSSDKGRIVALNLRLGDIWERWLADPAAAATRYYRVLDADPTNRQARLRLARLAENKGELIRARTLYEDILATEEDLTDVNAIADIVATYTRLARVTFTASGPTAEAVTCLERAVELDPSNKLARLELCKLLRLRSEWARLVGLLVDGAKVASTPEESRRAYVEAARLELEGRSNAVAAEQYLSLVLASRPDDEEALALLTPLLVARGDNEELARRLYAAAEVTLEPERKAELLWRVAEVRRDSVAAYPYLVAALDANPYLIAAAEGLVEHCRAHGNVEQRAQALVRMAVACRQASDRARALFEAGSILHRELGRPREAEAVLREAAAQAADNVEIWLALAALQVDMGQLVAARVALEKALGFLTNDASGRALVHERLAALAERTGDVEGQAQHLLSAMAHGADGNALRPRLVKVLETLGRKDQLVDLLESWAANAEGDVADGLRLEAASICESSDQSERAAGLYRAVFLGKRTAALGAAKHLERLATERDDHATVAQALAYQLELAPASDSKGVLRKLLEAQIAAQDGFGAEASALKLLELDPTDAQSHRQLAEHYEHTKAFGKALDHWLALIYETRREHEDRGQRRQAFEHASALALEIAPEHVGRLRDGFDREFPEAPPAAVAKPYGELLNERAAWEDLLALRRHQIDAAGRTAKAEWRRDVAEILHRRLGRSAESIAYYQDVVAHQPDDAEARNCLVGILESLGRHNDLANLLFALSQLVGEGDDALAYGLKSAEVYAKQLTDDTSASQVLCLVAARPDVDADASALHTMLRRYGLFDELVQLHERSVGATPDPDDGRFAELVSLLSNQVRDPARAVAWCARMIEAFAAADKPRRLLVDLLVAHPDLGDSVAALHAWAEARSGKDRAPVLAELGHLLFDQGRSGDGVAALEQAAVADPTAESVLQELIERATAAGDFPRALVWLEKLASVVEPGNRQDELWRRVVQIATDYVDDLDAAARALEGITHRSEDETRQLVELLAERQIVDGLSSLAGTAGGLPADLVLKAGAALAKGGKLEQARLFLEQAIARGDAQAAWDAADEGWRAAGKLEELGRWRLQAARHCPAGQATLLRLLGYADVIESGQSVGETLSPTLFDGLAREVDITRSEGAWALFRAARAFEQETWLDQAMRSLERVLAENDPRLLMVLHYRIERDLAARRFDAAAKLTERLLVLGDPDADHWMEIVLSKAGRREDLLRYLLVRAESAGEGAAPLWTRIASWYAEAKQWAKAVAALERVPGNDRTAAWGELMCVVAAAVDDPVREAEGATVCAQFVTDDNARATWLRRAGRLWWWRLGEQERGCTMLQEAQKLVPVVAATLRQEVQVVISSGQTPQAERLLAEATAILEGGEAAAFHVLRAQLALSSRDAPQAESSLTQALQLVGDDAALLGEIAELARSVRRFDLALEAYRRAASQNVDYQTQFLRALEESGEWAELLEILEKLATTTAAPADTAKVLERAADICTEHLTLPERALTLLVQAADLAPSAGNLSKAFALAERFAQAAVIAHLGAPLLERLAPSASDRSRVLRAYINALDSEGRTAETRAGREELVMRKLASANDKLVLGRLYGEAEAGRAAPLIEQAALDPELEDEPAVLVEAARLWQQLKQTDRARALLQQALTRGFDELDAHTLGMEILSGAARLVSVRRLIDAEADGDWLAEQRATARVEVAEACLNEGDAEAALALLLAAAKLMRVPKWAESMERAYAALQREDDLARLWLDEIEARTAPWTAEERLSRLSRAIAAFRGAADVERELRALDALLALDPTVEAALARVAELAIAVGDEDRYVALQRGRLAHTTTEEQRRQLAREAAQHLMEHFESPGSAADLLTPEVMAHPSVELAELLEQALVKAGREDETRPLLHRAAPSAVPPERAALWSFIGQMADVAGDSEEAYQCYRHALDDDATLPLARDYCLHVAEASERWSEAVQIIEAAAKAGASPASELWLQAAQITRAHLADANNELRLLQAALVADPTCAAAAARSSALLLDRNDVDGTMGVLMAGHVPADTEIELTPRLVLALSEGRREGDAELMMEWFSDRHPTTTNARDYRLQLARKRGDAGALLAELSARLDHAGEMPADELARVRIEAARAALQVGESTLAVSYLSDALTNVGEDVAALYAAWCVIIDWGNAELEQQASVQGARMREEVFAEAEAATGQSRIRWLELLGRSYESASDDTNAMSAYSQVLTLEPTKPSSLAVTALERLYTRRGDWRRLADLHAHLGNTADTPLARANALVRAAELWRDQLGQEARAEEYLQKALDQDSTHAQAQLDYGLLQWSRQRYGKALPYLQAQVAQAEDASVENLVALAECLQHTGAHAQGRDIIDRAIVIDPERVELYRQRAELVEKCSNSGDAEAAWLYYVQMLSLDANAEREQVYRRLAALAGKRKDAGSAIAYLEQANRITPDAVDIIGELRSMYELGGRWPEAAEQRLREASLAVDPQAQAGHFRALAVIYRDHLDDSIMAAAMLEKVSELLPTDVGVVEELVALYRVASNWPQYVVTAERLLRLDSKKRTALFLAQLSEAYEEAGDLLRAKELVDEGATLDPDNFALKARRRALAQATGDYRGYALAEEQDLKGLVPSDEKLPRLLTLADVYIKHLNAPERAAAALEQARELDPENPGIARRIADIYAVEPATYAKAADAYRVLLAATPLDTDLLRILARLAGQLGDTDRAYGYYAALLALVTDDGEAQRFVEACRSARSAGPQRPLTDTDRAAGLLHPTQASPIEEVFTPLARFAELTQPGDLTRRGVTQRDVLPPTDPRQQQLSILLEALGVSQAEIYIWRGGSYTCDVELTSPPAILLGSMLASDAPERQRAFFVARAAELYRSGHVLCEKLNQDDLGGLLAALCVAIDAQAAPPAATRDTPRWAAIIGAPMTAQIRTTMAPRVDAYLKAASNHDIAAWRRGCTCSASRTAMLVGCDIEEALSALLRLRGFDDIDDEQRRSLLQEAPEELDLMRFAVSEQYFKLRASLGLALRRSK